MTALFADIPEAIANTSQLAARLSYTLADLGYRFPPYPAPDGHTMDSFLRYLAYEGMSKRYGRHPEKVCEQVEKELALIAKLELAGYFLIVWDIVRFLPRPQHSGARPRIGRQQRAVLRASRSPQSIRKSSICCSNASSRKTATNGLTSISTCPAAISASGPSNTSTNSYGRLGAAMTANVITYRGRSAAREVGKALGFDVERTSALAKLAPTWGYTDDQDAAEVQFRQAGIGLERPAERKFLTLFQAIQDLPRHLGQHSGGMVICAGSLDCIVPLQPATMPGRVVVQWDKDDCADMKIVKVDLLGLGMMAVLEESHSVDPPASRGRGGLGEFAGGR